MHILIATGNVENIPKTYDVFRKSPSNIIPYSERCGTSKKEMCTVDSEEAKGLNLERKMILITTTTTTNHGSTDDACD